MPSCSTIQKSEEPCAQTENAVSVETTESQTDFYQILGVDEDASYPEIKKKWLKLSLIYHPDKCDGNDEMFRKINLAYKVLSNPENRKKYNDSLAKTYDQLKDTNRDMKYHVNQEFLRQSEDDPNRATFDRKKFLNEFEHKRAQFQHLNDVEVINEEEAKSIPKKTIEELMAERNSELEQYIQQQKTELFDPRKNNEEFNYVFQQYRRMTRTDLEESNLSDLANQMTPESQLDFSPVGLNDQRSVPNMHQMIKNLTSDFSHQFGEQEPIPVVTTQQKIPQSQLDALIEARQRETEEICENFQEKVENTIDDSDKLVVVDELITEEKEIDSQ